MCVAMSLCIKLQSIEIPGPGEAARASKFPGSSSGALFPPVCQAIVRTWSRQDHVGLSTGVDEKDDDAETVHGNLKACVPVFRCFDKKCSPPVFLVSSYYLHLHQPCMLQNAAKCIDHFEKTGGS